MTPSNPTEKALPSVALVQTTSTDDYRANLEYGLAMVAQAAARGAQVVAFPEVFLFIGGRQKKLELAQSLDGEAVDQFRQAAQQSNIAVLMGSFHEKIPDNPERVYNTSVWIDAQGEIVATYRKMKLFDVELPQITIRESDTVKPGDMLPPVFDTPVGRVGLTICFDLRYPELFQHLRKQGAEVIFVPSNFTAHTGAAHWNLLLRARAVENQVYIAAPAQYGKHNEKFTSYGHTLLANPWGNVTAQAADQAGLILGEIDHQLLRRVRQELPMGVPSF